MARIKVCFVWHMHQPFYRDLVSGEYRQPWARLHGLKDYFGMVQILEEFPKIRQTFNLVPSLLVQLEEYASGKAKDRFLEVALKETELLTPEEREFLLGFAFQANEERVIDRYSRYAELLRVARQYGHAPREAAGAFTTGMLRDLQVLSQLAWFDEEYLAKDPEVRSLAEKGRGFTRADQELIGRKEREVLARVISAYRGAVARGQIEVSTSPFYHPILPLLCDSNIADVSHPYVALPTQFAYADDAAAQMTEAKGYIEKALGCVPAGLWPPEGAVSDQVLETAAQMGFRWMATDDGILERTLGHSLSAEDRYQPHLWRGDGREMRLLFRDRRLCELMGVVYARMSTEDAVSHFVHELHKVSARLLRTGRDATITLVLDGENPWEHYLENGRPFLRSLYARISESTVIEAVTASEAVAIAEPAPLEHIYPGSGVDGNFDIWIGAEEDNRAWELLLSARRKFDEAKAASAEDRALAWQELLIAEGSDWFWWYGPEHSAESRGEFDRLFREHLANVYRLLGEQVPGELAHSFLKPHEPDHRAPAGMIQPTIDGRLTTRGEWANAGRYRAAHTSGAVHSLRPPIHELLYGTDGNNLFLWLGLGEAKQAFEGMEFLIQIRNASEEEFQISVRSTQDELTLHSPFAEGSVQVAVRDGCEMRISLAALHSKQGSQLFFKVGVWSEGLPMGSVPGYGLLELKHAAMAAYTF